MAGNESYAEYVAPVFVEDPTIYFEQRGLDHGLRIYSFRRPHLATNQSFAEYVIPVFAEDPTIYFEYRGIDHGLRLYPFLRPKPTTIASQPMAYKTPAPPAWTLLEDKFALAYPILEAYTQKSLPVRPQPFFALQFTSNRIDDLPQEEQFHRVDQNSIEYFRHGAGQENIFYYLPIQFEILDLCDNPWLEWVHPGPAPESQLAPFSTQSPFIPGQNPPNLIYSYAAPNWRIEAEDDPRYARRPDYSNSFREIYVTSPNVVTERVMATAVGIYNNIEHNIGDVFDIVIADFSSQLINYIPGQIGSPLFGWMVVVAPSTPLSFNPPAQLVTPAFNGTTQVSLSQTNKPRTVY